MTIIMGGGMMIVMLLFMLGMYRSVGKNIAVIATAIILLVAGIGLVRSQITADDVDYMEGMIPHYSIAILTSERAKITDPPRSEPSSELGIESAERAPHGTCVFSVV